MSAALSLAAAVALLAVDLPRWTTRECQRGEAGRAARGIPCGTAQDAGPELPAYFEFLPLSGLGAPTWPDFCSAIGQPTNGGWCMNADGTMAASSSRTIALGGDATVIDDPTCSNGADCSTMKKLKFTTTGYAATESFALSTNGVPTTACWYGYIGKGASSDNYNDLLTHTTTRASSDTVFFLDFNRPNYEMYVRNSTCSAAAWKPGVPQLVCVVHGGVSSSSIPKMYVDGVDTCTGNLTFIATSATAKTTIGGSNGGAAEWGDDMATLGAFVAYADLRASLATMYTALQAHNTQALIDGGVSLAMQGYSRTGSRFCSKSDNTGTILQANRPCVARGGILTEEAATNRILRSQEIDNAAWTKGAGATVTANYATAPDGTKTAERLVYTGTNGYVLQADALTTLKTQSVFLKGTSGSGEINFGFAGSSTTNKRCAYTSTAWSRCTRTATDAAATNMYLGCASSLGATASCAANGDVLVWGAQNETGPEATAYKPTLGATASTGADATPYFDLPASVVVRSMSALGSADGNKAQYAGLMSTYASGTVRNWLNQGGDISSTDQYMQCWWRDGVDKTINSYVFLPKTFNGFVSHRCTYDGATALSSLRGYYETSAQSFTPSAMTRVYVGGLDVANNSWRGFSKAFCADSSATKCVGTYGGATDVVALGDSITRGDTSAPTRYPYELGGLISRTVVNAGVSANTAAQCRSRYTASISGKGYATVIILCSVNSINNGLTDAQTWSDLSAIASDARGQGMKVVWVKTTPWKSFSGWTSGKQAYTNALWATMQADCAASPSTTTCVNTASLGGQGGDPDVMLATLDYGDGLHFNAAGSTALASVIATGVP